MFAYINDDPKLYRQYAETCVFGIFSCCVYQGRYVRVLSLQRWSLEMEMELHPTLYNGCNDFSMLGLKLSHVSKRAPGRHKARLQNKCQFILILCPPIHPSISIFRVRCCPCPTLWGWQHQTMLNTGSPCISVWCVNAGWATLITISLHTFRPCIPMWVGVGGFFKVVATFSHLGGSFNLSMATTRGVRIIPSFRIWDYVLHVEHLPCVITICG